MGDARGVRMNFPLPPNDGYDWPVIPKPPDNNHDWIITDYDPVTISEPNALRCAKCNTELLMAYGSFNFPSYWRYKELLYNKFYIPYNSSVTCEEIIMQEALE